MSANATEYRNESDTTLNAVIIYDTFDLAANAKTIMERAAHRTDENTRWKVKPWRVDMLRMQSLAQAALVEAADAHLILLAVHKVQSLLPWFLDWLDRWARSRQVLAAGLAVWDRGNPESRSARSIPELSLFAERHGLSLVYDDSPLVEDSSSKFESELRKREVYLTPTLRHILGRTVSDGYQHWGLNE